MTSNPVVGSKVLISNDKVDIYQDHTTLEAYSLNYRYARGKRKESGELIEVMSPTELRKWRTKRKLNYLAQCEDLRIPDENGNYDESEPNPEHVRNMFTFTFDNKHLPKEKEIKKEIKKSTYKYGYFGKNKKKTDEKKKKKECNDPLLRDSKKFWKNHYQYRRDNNSKVGKHITVVEYGKNTNRLHNHSLTTLPFPEIEAMNDFWEGMIHFRNIGSKSESIDIINKKLRKPKKGIYYSSKDLFLNKKNGRQHTSLRPVVNNGTNFKLLLTLLKKEYYDEKQMEKDLKRFIDYIKEDYDLNLTYYAQLLYSKKYKTNFYHVLLDIECKEIQIIGKQWDKGFIEVTPIKNKKEAIKYTMKYAAKNIANNRKYGTGYTWSRGLPKVPKGWKSRSKISEYVDESLAEKFIKHWNSNISHYREELVELMDKRERQLTQEREENEKDAINITIQNKKAVNELKKQEQIKMVNYIEKMNDKVGRLVYTLTNIEESIKDGGYCLKYQTNGKICPKYKVPIGILNNNDCSECIPYEPKFKGIPEHRLWELDYC